MIRLANGQTMSARVCWDLGTGRNDVRLDLGGSCALRDLTPELALVLADELRAAALRAAEANSDAQRLSPVSVEVHHG